MVSMRNSVAEPSQAATLQRVYRALERDRQVDAGAHPMSLLISDGTLVIEGEVTDEDAKERAVEIARETVAVRRVVNRLVVMPRVKRRTVKRMGAKRMVAKRASSSSSTSPRRLRPRLRRKAR
jgi:hypothetical protein